MNKKMIGNAWKCVDAELQWQICSFPYVELSDVPRLQQVERKKRRTAEESRTKLCVLDVAIKIRVLLLTFDLIYFQYQQISPLYNLEFIRLKSQTKENHIRKNLLGC